MNLDITQIAGIALLLFAGYNFLKKRGIDPVDKVGDSVEDLLDKLKINKEELEAIEDDKIALLKRFVKALDPKKDKDKMAYLIDTFGLDFLRDYVYDNQDK